MSDFQLIEPDESLADFVYCFTSLQDFQLQQDAVIIPNGKIDLIFSKTEDKAIRIAIMGLETRPKYTRWDVTNLCSVSFNPLAVEYILEQPVAALLNSGKFLPAGFWGIDMEDLGDFSRFCSKMSAQIQSVLPKNIDTRKLTLFRLLFASNGEISVEQLSEQVSWSQRQINRYFNKQFGLSLKAYCKILRFQASLSHIQSGKLHPQLNFTDQSHFIKEVKQFSGVSPKALYKNENDRFLQFLAYKDK